MAIGSLLGGVAGAAASILSGGTLGVLGAIGSGVLDFFKTKEKNKQELAIITAQKELALVNKDSLTLLETIKLSAASYENDKAHYSGNLSKTDMLRGTLRPIVTYALLIVSTVLCMWAFKRVSLEQAVVTEIAKYSVYTCLDLTALCVSWYFGARQIDKIQRK
jgi:hypothetical protein